MNLYEASERLLDATNEIALASVTILAKRAFDKADLLRLNRAVDEYRAAVLAAFETARSQ